MIYIDILIQSRCIDYDKNNILTDINKLYLSLCPTTNKLISIDGTYGNTNI